MSSYNAVGGTLKNFSYYVYNHIQVLMDGDKTENIPFITPMLFF
jgi:hypothetical protein